VVSQYPISASVNLISISVTFPVFVGMSGRGASGLETDLQIWAKVMGIIPLRNSSEVFRKSVFVSYMKQI
jgi:hypothetical protein